MAALMSLLFFFILVWLAKTMFYWAYPGGPAWGKKRATLNPKDKPIPGPRGYPFIGSMNLMLNLAHQNLASVAKSLGAKRLMAFSLGETRVILTCHPEVAREILNSLAFMDRPVKESAYSLMFNRAIGFAPHGLYWRTLRRISANHLFCPTQMSSFESQRCRIASQMVQLISARQAEEFRVRDILKRASLNNMLGIVFGPEYETDISSDNRDELSRLVEEGYELLGQLNWGDHLPWLANFDPQKIRHRCSILVPKVNQIVGRIITERRSRKKLEGEKNQNFVDVLLSIDGPNTFSDSDMVAVLWEMIFRGSDTVAVLLEWILARMVLHPKIQSQLQNELDETFKESEKLTDSNISKMKYLRGVVKESLRLHPPGPLLSWARLATVDTTIDGHFIPAGTTAMVNMWAIMRDSDIWSDPLVFRPERFMTRQGEMDISVMGSDLRLAPFGSGRRACPGKVLGLTTVSLWVASLLHEFKWVSSDHNTVDLSEVLKLSCEMATPLTVKAYRRRLD